VDEKAPDQGRSGGGIGIEGRQANADAVVELLSTFGLVFTPPAEKLREAIVFVNVNV
jgi:hypothetical protein